MADGSDTCLMCGRESYDPACLCALEKLRRDDPEVLAWVTEGRQKFLKRMRKSEAVAQKLEVLR